jgi:glycosyltransferase involved in cell wall biosynthesis
MSKFLYITADQIGLPTGGGAVTFHESQALKELGPTEAVDRTSFADISGEEPWKYDQWLNRYIFPQVFDRHQFKLAHGYAGTFTETVKRLKDNGCKVTWTCAAHDVDKSRAEHDKLGIPFQYDHLNVPEQFERYIGGYKLADVLITPSKHSHDVLRRQGCTNDIRIIPHGCDLPADIKPLPKRFTVGYLGAIGADKGLIYLIQAWAKLKYKDATLVIAGRDSTHPAVRYLLHQAGAGNVQLAGWQDNVSDFYDSISLYVQPSVTEGFGIEVLEAQAHGRCVVCSDGAGAADTIPEGWRFPACDAMAVADRIDCFRREGHERLEQAGRVQRINAVQYTWDKIRERYKSVWRELLK